MKPYVMYFTINGSPIQLSQDYRKGEGERGRERKRGRNGKGKERKTEGEKGGEVERESKKEEK